MENPFHIHEDKQANSKIIDDDTYLDVSYVPEEILHREQEINHILESTIAPAVRGNTGSHGLIRGRPGTGKTATVRYTLERVKAENDLSDIQFIYVNCNDSSSARAVFMQLCRRRGLEVKDGLANNHYIKKFLRDVGDEDRTNALVVLDEIHSLHDRRSSRDNLSHPVLYNLSRPREAIGEARSFDGSLTILGISNDSDIESKIADDVKSSLQHESYHFDPYTEQQIKEILMDRYEKSFSTNILEDKQIERISRILSKSYDSDLRKGIEVLQKIGTKISNPDEVKESSKTQKELVEDVFIGMERSQAKDYFSNASKHELLVSKALIHTTESNDEQPSLPSITEAYQYICEEMDEEERRKNFKSRKQWVYKTLGEQIDRELLVKRKNHETSPASTMYYTDIRSFVYREVLEDYLEYSGLKKRLELAEISRNGDEDEPSEPEDIREEMNKLIDASQNSGSA